MYQTVVLHGMGRRSCWNPLANHHRGRGVRDDGEGTGAGLRLTRGAERRPEVLGLLGSGAVIDLAREQAWNRLRSNG